MKDQQSRKWQLTINNPADKGITHETIKQMLIQIKPVVYYCMADEIGLETKTPHTHVFICAKSPVRFSRIKKLFPDFHIEPAHGTVQENKDYVQKNGKWAEDVKADTRIDNTFEEWGEIPDEPGQGHRSDIEGLYDMIVDGMSNAEIMAEQPALARYVNSMDKIRQEILEARFRKEFRHLEVTYIFGSTATGKTRYVMEKYGYENVFRVTDYQHPFDRYAQEPVLLLDEFRSSVMIGDILDFLDGYPLTLPARYAPRVACYTTVYIISNIDLKAQFPNVQEYEPETWRAFLRRIHHVLKFHYDRPPTDHGSAMDYIFPPQPPAPDWVRELESSLTEQIDIAL